MFSAFFIKAEVCLCHLHRHHHRRPGGHRRPACRPYPELAPPRCRSLPTTRAPMPRPCRHGGRPIESRVNGVENMIYMSSNSANNGSYSLTISFKPGTDPDIDTVIVQNRVARPRPELPEEVKRHGVTVTKQSTDIGDGGRTSFRPTRPTTTLTSKNYANIRVRD